jgi:hypothetical protein
VGVIGTGRFFWRFVVFGGQRAHRVEFTGHFPAQLFAAASKHDVLFAQLDCSTALPMQCAEVAQAELME